VSIWTVDNPLAAHIARPREQALAHPHLQRSSDNMKRMSIVPTILLAMLAVSSFSVSSAAAARYGQCEKAEKAAKKLTGDFTDKNCVDRATVEQEEAGIANKFVLRHDFVVDPVATTLTTKHFVLQVGTAGEKLECARGRGAGEILDTADSEGTLSLEGCLLKSPGAKIGAACTSPGQSSGTIGFGYLAEQLSHGEGSFTAFEPKEGEAVTQFRILGAQFECGDSGILDRLSEFVSGTDTGDVDTSSSKEQLTISTDSAEQRLLLELGESRVEGELTATIDTKFAKPIVLELCDEPGASAEGLGEEVCPPTGSIG
jgi:hypothetical protein